MGILRFNGGRSFARGLGKEELIFPTDVAHFALPQNSFSKKRCQFGRRDCLSRCYLLALSGLLALSVFSVAPRKALG